MSKKQIDFVNKIMYIFRVSIVSSLLLLSVFFLMAHYFFNALSNDVITINSGWVDESGNPFDLSSFSPNSGENYHSQKAYYKLYDISEGTYLLFRSRNMFTDVYINDELVSVDNRDINPILGTSPGSRWHYINVSPSSSCITLCIEGTTVYSNSNGIVDNLYLGFKDKIFAKTFTERLTSFLVSTILMFIGALLMIIYLFVHKKYNMGNDFFYLGGGTFFAGQWLSVESLAWQLMIGNSELFHILIYLSLIGAPICFAVLASYRLKGKLQYGAMILAFVACINAFITSLLHFTGILEYHYSIKPTHFLIFALIPFMIMTALSYTQNSGKTRKYMGILLLVIFTLSLITGIFQYTMNKYSSYVVYSRIATISFIVALIVFESSNIIHLFTTGLEAEMMHNLATTDYMTKLYNRAAYAEDEIELKDRLEHNLPLGIIVLDINNLKTINDTLGHEKGDLLIITASDVLRKSFELLGKIYRTGGDEFLVTLATNNPESDYNTGITTMNYLIEEINSTNQLGFKLQIAHGFAIANTSSLDETISSADAKMYINKKYLKENS